MLIKTQTTASTSDATSGVPLSVCWSTEDAWEVNFNFTSV